MNLKPIYELRQKQSLPLEAKIEMTKNRIREWIDWCANQDKNTYVSFSGGLDSTVLLDIVRKVDPSTKAVFDDTGLENLDLVKFVKTFDNVDIIRPKLNFVEVIKKYGYPLFSKEIAECVEQGRKSLELNNGAYAYRLQKLYGTATDTNGNKSLYNKEKYGICLDAPFKISGKCCKASKKDPFDMYNKTNNAYPIIGTTCEESQSRETSWRKTGCNGFKSKKPKSQPLSFWLHQDILEYICNNNLPYCKEVYGNIEYKDNQISLFDDEGIPLTTTKAKRSGCKYCLFGAHMPDDERLLLLKKNNRKRYDFVLGGGEFVDGMWQPNSEGLGFAYVIDWCNTNVKNCNIKY
ncbi:MAG: phosphoadenosine phosphosulfate reductase family protein [Clostridia bacterium]